MSMHIALLSWESLHSVQVGGLALHVSELAAALRQRGHDVHIITRRGDGQPLYNCVDGVHHHRCDVEPCTDFMLYITRMCDSFVRRLVQAEAFYGRPFDIIHGHDWLCAQSLTYIKQEMKRRTLLTMHSSEFGRCGNAFSDGLSSRIRDVEWQGVSGADRVICVSRALRDEVVSVYKIPVDKTAVVYNGIDVTRFDAEVDVQAVRARHGIPAGAPMILYAGRLAWQKGPDLLLDSVPDVLLECPETRFVIAGEGDMRSCLEGRAGRMGLFNTVRFVGRQSGHDLVGLFKAADVVCVPSRNEPFGLVILEAWSASKPVVVTRSGGPNEFVRDHQTGLTVSADRESISWGLGSVLADAEGASSWGHNGRHEAESRFSWQCVAAQTEEIYQAA